MDWIEANRLARRNQCAECNALLTVLPDPLNRYRVVCSADHHHVGFTKVPSVTELWRQGAALPLEVANRLEKKFGGEQMATTELMKLDKAEVERRMKVAMKHFGFVVDQYGAARAPNVEEMVLLVDYSVTYGFDPLLHEVCLYQGRPYPMIDGLRRKAHETGQYRGLKLEPILDPDFKVALGFQPMDIVFKATVKKASGPIVPEIGKYIREYTSSEIITEYERYDGVTDAEINEMTTKGTLRNPVIAKRSSNMAQVRAERDALRAAFSFQFPEPTVPIEGEYHEVEEEIAVGLAVAAGGVAALARKAEPKAEPHVGTIRDLNSVVSVQDYLDACRIDYGLDETAALAEANATTRMDIINPREAYRQVAVVREG